MATEYQVAASEVFSKMKNLIRDHHPDLMMVIDRIQILFRYPASKSNGEPVLGKAQKVSDKVNTLADTDFVFLLEIAGEEWEMELDVLQREALLYHLLSQLEVEVNEDGEEKYKMRPYDVVGFREEFERYGVGWRPKFNDDPLPPLNTGVEVNPDKKKEETSDDEE